MKLFEIELIICIKMDLVLNNLQTNIKVGFSHCFFCLLKKQKKKTPNTHT